jgi:hypothetical protein
MLWRGLFLFGARVFGDTSDTDRLQTHAFFLCNLLTAFWTGAKQNII